MTVGVVGGSVQKLLLLGSHCILVVSCCNVLFILFAFRIIPFYIAVQAPTVLSCYSLVSLIFYTCVCRFQKLSTRWFREFPWPEAERISDFVEQDELFLHLYRELYYRHIYAMHKVGTQLKLARFA